LQLGVNQKKGVTTMATRKRKAITAAAAFLAFALSQVYVQAGLPNAPIAPVPQRVINATLHTKNNQPVSINGNPAGTGTTLLTDTTVETPDQVSATITVGDTTVEVGPNSKIKLTFDADGNVHVQLLRGCASTRNKQNAVGEADVFTDTVKDVTNASKRQAGGCLLPNGQLGSFPSAGLTAVEEGAIGAGIAGGVVTAVVLARGGNSSPSN
jgi:hypothetical protein